MPDTLLIHPPRVAAALDRIDGGDGAMVRSALVCADPSSPDYLPSEVLVRLLRRCRLDPDRWLERAASVALVARIGSWVRRRYNGLSRDDRQEMSQGLLERIAKEVGRQAAIDWWEVTFAINLERAAADIYQGMFDKVLRAPREDIGDHPDVLDDGGGLSRDMLEDAIINARAAKVLDEDELRLFYPLFISLIPLSSPRAPTDLVRRLGRPEGTLREIKTAMKAKLQAAFTESEE